MPSKDLGQKLTCWKCGTKFYDLKKPDPVCPKCGANPREAPQSRPSPPAERRRPAKEPAFEEVVEPVEEADLDEELEDEAEDDSADDGG